MRLRSPYSVTFRGLAVAAAVVVLGLSHRVQAAPYTVTILPDLPGFASGVGESVNDLGQIAGYDTAAFSQQTEAFVWSQATGIQNLGVLPGNNGASYALGINARGQVAGYTGGPLIGTRSFLWTPGTGAQDIGTLPGPGDYTFAQAINNSAQIAGYGNGVSGQHAFLWSSSTGMQDLGTLPGGTDSYANGISNAGQVVGYSTGGSGTDAFLWTSSTGMQDLGTLPGSNSSSATAVNDAGQVVGYSTIGADDHAFLWSSATGMEDLGTLDAAFSSFDSSTAQDINASGFVVGTSEASDGNDAFIWNALTGITDLNTLIDPGTFILQSATSISDNGFITGFGYDSATGLESAYLLTPTTGNGVPTPGALTLTAFGLLMIGMARRQRMCATKT